MPRCPSSPLQVAFLSRETQGWGEHLQLRFPELSGILEAPPRSSLSRSCGGAGREPLLHATVRRSNQLWSACVETYDHLCFHTIHIQARTAQFPLRSGSCGPGGIQLARNLFGEIPAGIAGLYRYETIAPASGFFRGGISGLSHKAPPRASGTCERGSKRTPTLFRFRDESASSLRVGTRQQPDGSSRKTCASILVQDVEFNNWNAI